MKNIFLVLFAAAVIFTGCDDDKNDKPDLTQMDRDFADFASRANLAEIELGQLAAGKSSNQAVKDFGSHMVSEHTNSVSELQAIIDNKNYSMAAEPDDEHKALKAKLQGLNGMAFDTVYVNSQVKDHQMVISSFQQESTGGNDSDLKAYATKTLPHLNEHLSTAIELQSALNVAAARDDD